MATESPLTVAFLASSTMVPGRPPVNPGDPNEEVVPRNVLNIPDGVDGQRLVIIAQAPVVFDGNNIRGVETLELDGPRAQVWLVWNTTTQAGWYVINRKQGVIVT